MSRVLTEDEIKARVEVASMTASRGDTLEWRALYNREASIKAIVTLPYDPDFDVIHPRGTWPHTHAPGKSTYHSFTSHPGVEYLDAEGERIAYWAEGRAAVRRATNLRNALTTWLMWQMDGADTSKIMIEVID